MTGRWSITIPNNMIIIILDLEVGAYFFFHGSLVGRRYNMMYYYCTVYRTPFVGTTIPSLADNTSATDNRWYRLSNVFSASTTRQSLSHRVVYLSRATNFRRPSRREKTVLARTRSRVRAVDV